MARTLQFIVIALLAPVGQADEPNSTPKEIPATRPQQKQALETLKKREARLPLPPPTAEELKPREGSSSGLGGRVVNNGRMRSLYLPPELRGGGARAPGGERPQDPSM